MTTRGDIAQAPPSPYRDILPFRYVDRPYFFGRSTPINDLLVKVLISRFVLLFGESGAGKSSLINAGLIPVFEKEGLKPERLRVRPLPDEPILVERIPTTETEDGPWLPSIFADREGTRVGDQGPVLPCSLDWFLQAIRSASANAHPVLIFDQFEELFTLFEQRSGGETAEKIKLQEKLFAAVLRIVNDESLKVKVLLVVREDFLAKLEILAKNYPRVFDHRVRLQYLNGPEARQAICEPFKLETNPFVSRLGLDLADRVLKELSEDQSNCRIQPTQLQIICSRLWKEFAANLPEIGVKQFAALGGVKGILEGFFQSELTELNLSQRTYAIQILGHLITESDTRDVVSQDKLRGLLDRTERIDEKLFLSTLDFLEKHRLINAASQRGTVYYEVASEYLIPPIKRERRQLIHQRELAAAQASAKEREAARQRELKTTRIVAASLAVLILLTTLAAIAAVQQRRIARSREAAANAITQLSSDFDLSLLLASAAARISRTDQAEDALQQAVLAKRERAVLRGHTGFVNTATFSPNGRFIVTAGADSQARVWDVGQRQTVTLFTKHTNSINTAVFSRDSEWVLTASDDRTARIWEARTGHELVKVGLPSPVQAAEFSADGGQFATISGDDTVRCWEAKTGNALTGLPPQTNSVTSFAYSPDGRLLAIACDDNVVRLWEIATRQHLTNLVGHSEFINDVSFSLDNQLVVTASDDHSTRVWRVDNGRLIAEFISASGYALSGVFSPNGKLVLTAGRDKTARVFDLGTKETVLELKGHDDILNAASYDPDGKFVVTAGADGTARLWEAPAPYSLAPVREFQGPIYPLAFAKTSNLVVTATRCDISRTYKTHESPATPRQQLVTSPEVTLAYSPDRQFAVVTTGEGRVNVRSLWSRAVVFLSGHTQRVASAAFSSEGLFVATGSMDGTARIWEARTGQPIGQPKQHGAEVTSAAFSSNSQFMVTASADGTAGVWAVADERNVPALRGHEGVVTCAVFSLDGRWVGTAGTDKTARLWDARTGEQFGKPFLHEDSVNCVAFHPDGKSLLTGSEDGNIRRWSLANQRLMSTLRGTEPLASVLPTPDGHWVVAVTRSRTTKIYPWEIIAPVDDLITLANRRSARQLTPEERRRYLHER